MFCVQLYRLTVLLCFRALVSQDPAGIIACLRAATPDGRRPCPSLPLPPPRPPLHLRRGLSPLMEEEANL